MTEQMYRLILGSLLITFLYFEVRMGVAAMAGLMMFEGFTNWRVPILLSRLRHGTAVSVSDRSCSVLPQALGRINFDAERALRLVFSGLLVLAYFVFPDETWFVPWFMGLSLIAAGLSGFCPMIIMLGRIGFK